MRYRIVPALAACVAAYSLAPADAPRDLVQNALAAMGGEAAIRGIRTLRFESIGFTNLLEQSERQEAPWLQNYTQVSEFRDFAAGRIWSSTSSRVFNVPKWPDPSIRIAAAGTAALHPGNRWLPGSPSDRQSAEEKLALAPERLLLTALAAPDLRTDADFTFQDVPHHSVSFTWKGHPVRLLLNAHTGLPTAVELTCAYPFDTFWNVWGDGR